MWTERYNALTEQQKRRHVKGAQAAPEAQRLGGRGYAPAKRMEGRSERQHAVDDLALVMRGGVEVDPTTNSASRSLSALNLDSNVDFDAGIRALRGSLRKAATAERIAESIQSDVLNRHDQSVRGDTGCVTGVPHDVAQLLNAADWRLQPHDVAHQTFKHFRGSFPIAVDTVATLGKCNLKKEAHVVLHAKLRAVRAALHQPAIHDEAPVITKEEAATHASDCHTAGFCVHGSDGRDVVAMRAQLRAAITRTRFPKANKLGRELLSTSGVVIVAVAEEVADVAPDAAVGGASPVTVHNNWLHLGVVDLRRAEFEGQTLGHSGGNLAIAGDCVEVGLEGQWVFQDSWSFVRYMDKRLHWYLRFFFLPDSSRPLGTIRPIQCNAVELTPWPAASNRAVLFWRGGRDVEKAKRREQRRLQKEAVGAAQPRLRERTRIDGIYNKVFHCHTKTDVFVLCKFYTQYF